MQTVSSQVGNTELYIFTPLVPFSKVFIRYGKGAPNESVSELGYVMAKWEKMSKYYTHLIFMWVSIYKIYSYLPI